MSEVQLGDTYLHGLLVQWFSDPLKRSKIKGLPEERLCNGVGKVS